jgi:ABC-2 type transport system permease protein
MNTTSSAMNDPHAGAPAAMAPNITQASLLYWSIRRELWENKSVYIAPIAATVVFLLGYLLASSHLGVTMFQVSSGDPDAARGDVFLRALNANASIVMGVSAIVGFFYSLDSLYSERRDRSILFWKSLPVSDLITIASKVAVPLVVLPAVAFLVIVVTQLFMLLLGSAVLAAHGQSVADLWSATSVLSGWLVLLYMMIVLSLWYAPIVGWLLLVSAWAQRLAILWAILLPFGLCLVEKIGFGTIHLFTLVDQRIGGGIRAGFDSEQLNQAFGSAATAGPPAWARNFHGVFGLTPDPLQFIASPGLWIGLALALAMFAGAIRLRRSREAL